MIRLRARRNGWRGLLGAALTMALAGKCGSVMAQVAAASGPATTQDAFALHDGDRVVFYGDSITAQRQYTQDVENAVRTRYPHLDVKFWNAGVDGDAVGGGGTGGVDRRLERDVFSFTPTVVTVMLGMNDGHYHANGEEAYPTYEQGYRALVKKLKARLPGVRIYLIEPSPYDEVTRVPTIAGYNGVMQRFGQIVERIGADEGVEVINANAPMVAELQVAKTLDPVQAAAVIPDRVHPGVVGHWLLAETLLKAWHLKPVVSSLRFDAVSLQTTAVQTTVSALAHEEPVYVWTQEDQALPLPLNRGDASTAFLLKISDLNQMDTQTLTITGLKPGRYKLSIDDAVVATFSAGQLTAGVNLSDYATPMREQAMDYMRLMERRVLVDLVRFEMITSGSGVKDRDTGIEALKELYDQRLIEATAKLLPQPRGYRLVRLP